MSTVEAYEETRSVNGVDIHVCHLGDPEAPPLVLIHGIYDHWESWSLIIHQLTPDYHLIMPDLRGHGQSSKPDSGYELTEYAADMAGVLQSLELSNALVTGHSLGALTTAYLAADYPDLVRAAVLEDPPTSFDTNVRARMQPLLDAKRSSEEDAYTLFREMNPNLGEDRWRDQARRLVNTADGPFEAVIALGEQERSGEIISTMARVHCPTLLVQADPAHGGVLKDSDAALARSALTNGELRSFEGVGHSIHKERPREFGDTLIAFLGRQTAAS